LLVIFFFLLSAMAIRNIPLFIIACTPLAGACWKDLKGLWFHKLRLPRPLQTTVAWVLILFLVGFASRIVTNAHYVSNRLTDRFGLGLDRDAQPLRACRFLVEN